MPWIKIATGTNLDNIQPVSDVQELVKGTDFNIYITTGYFPSGPLADLIGAEFVAALLVQGGEVKDVSGPSWNKVRIECVADPPLTIAAIILALAALGVLAYMITKVEIWADIADIIKGVAEGLKWIAIGVVAVCAVILVNKIPKRGEILQKMKGR